MSLTIRTTTMAGLLTMIFALFCNSLSFKTRQLMASFDDIPTEAESKPALDLYAGIAWTSFVLYTPRNVSWSSSDGLGPSSRQSYALAVSNVHNGFDVPNIGKSPFNPMAFFDLQKFNWGCLLLSNTTDMPMQPEKLCNCSLMISGYEANRGNVNPMSWPKWIMPEKRAIYFFETSADPIRGTQMDTVHLNGKFNACQRVTFDVQPATEEQDRNVALILDDVMLRTYHISAWDWKGFGQVVHENGPFGIA